MPVFSEAKASAFIRLSPAFHELQHPFTSGIYRRSSDGGLQSQDQRKQFLRPVLRRLWQTNSFNQLQLHLQAMGDESTCREAKEARLLLPINLGAASLGKSLAWTNTGLQTSSSTTSKNLASAKAFRYYSM